MKLNNFLLFLCCTLFSISAFSQTEGCYSSGSGYIYTDRDGFYMGVPNFKFDNVNDRYLRTSDVYCLTTSGTCRITVPDNSNAAMNNYPSANGQYVTFTMYRCPIDDYIWLLIFPIGFFGFYVLCCKGNVTGNILVN